MTVISAFCAQASDIDCLAVAVQALLAMNRPDLAVKVVSLWRDLLHVTHTFAGGQADAGAG
jgi:hypothetical protein